MAPNLENITKNTLFAEDAKEKSVHLCCRSPHGERGLKSPPGSTSALPGLSLPTGGAWIEIPHTNCARRAAWSLPIRGVWIEICLRGATCPAHAGRPQRRERGLKFDGPTRHRKAKLSLPTRGAWIKNSWRFRRSYSNCAEPVALCGCFAQNSPLRNRSGLKNSIYALKTY